MKFDSELLLMSDDYKGVIQLADRHFTNIGLIRRDIRVVIETPVKFFGNNPAGGEVSSEFIGAFTYFNYNPDIRFVDRIGRFCSIGPNSIIGINGHPTKSLSHHLIFEKRQRWSEPFWDYDEKWVDQNRENAYENEPKRKNKTVIGNDVWIGCNSVIMEGVKIGNGAIVGAGSVVTRDVPPYTIAGGNPARIIRERFSENVTERLQKISWWDYGPNVLKGLDIARPEQCLDELEERIEKGFPRYNADKFEIDIKAGTITKIYKDTEKRELIHW